MDRGYLLYKCRLCGKVVQGASTPYPEITAMQVDGGEYVHAMAGKTSQHSCKSGNIGICDLAGIEPQNIKFEPSA